MRKVNEENERIKRKYFHFIREADGKDEKTVEKVASAIFRFEEAINFKSFKRFNTEQAVAFKRRLQTTKNPKTGKPLSKSTIDSILRELRGFFRFLAGQQGYKSKISYSDAAYFNNNMNDARVAHAHRETRFPTMEQAKHAFDNMPEDTGIERRNRALFAFLMLTGARIGAIASLKLKHIDLIEGCVYQDARDVNTKRAKTFTTWFLPIDEDYRTVFYEWVSYLRDKNFLAMKTPSFPNRKWALGRQGVSRLLAYHERLIKAQPRSEIPSNRLSLVLVFQASPRIVSSRRSLNGVTKLTPTVRASRPFPSTSATAKQQPQ